MATLRVPQADKPGLAAILSLSDDAVDALVSALSNAPVTASRTELFRLVSRIPGVPSDAAGDIVTALLSLYSLRANLESPVPELVDDICDAMNASGSLELKLSDDKYPGFKSSLTKLLSIEPLLIRRKVIDVLYEHERTFCTARILTDVRPVFGENPEDPPVEVLITHTLKISYHKGDELEDIFIAMGSRGMESLRNAIDRADSKAKSLRSALDAAGISRSERMWGTDAERAISGM